MSQRTPLIDGRTGAGRRPAPSQRMQTRWAKFWWSLIGALVLTLSAPRAHAQQPLDFHYLDSLSLTLTAQSRWAELDSVGRIALRLGTDYPALRCRLGQAALALDQPAVALRHYSHALHDNPLDSTARYGLAVAYLALNQPGPAALLVRNLPDAQRRPLHLSGFQAITRIEAEASGQHPGTIHRGTAGFLRLGLSSRLSPRFNLTQNVSYFGQNIELPDPRRAHTSLPYTVRQNQYQALLAAQLAPRWQVLAGYHFLDNNFGKREAAPNQLGYIALAYARPYWTAQVGVFAGSLTDTTRVQTDLRLTVYPLGNLRLYGFGRASVVRSGSRSYPNGVLGAGGRLSPSLWLEAYGGLGQVPVLAELDGTYVYNLLDPLRQRAGTSLLILLNRPLTLRLSYAAEQRRDAVDGTTYTLYSLSTALAWTW